MRPDAPGGKLPNPLIVSGNIPDADNALACVYVVLCGEYQRAVSGKCAMSVKMASHWAFKLGPDSAAAAVKNKGKGARTAGEGNGFCAQRVGGGSVSSRRQGAFKGNLACLRQPTEFERPVRRACSRYKGGVAHIRPACARRGTQGQKPGKNAATALH